MLPGRNVHVCVRVGVVAEAQVRAEGGVGHVELVEAAAVGDDGVGEDDAG